jgi:hypothetical protein
MPASMPTDRLFASATPQLRHVVISHRPICGLAESVDPTLLSAMEDDVGGSDRWPSSTRRALPAAPKGVVHTHAALLGHQRNLNDIRCLTAEDKLFCNSPFFWIGGFAFGLLATLIAGSTLVCSNATDPGD